MSARRTLVRALAVALGLSLGAASAAAAEGPPTPLCTPAGGSPAECGPGWYTTPVSVEWHLNGGTAVAGCASQNYSEDTDQSDLLGEPNAPPWTYCTVTLPRGTDSISYLIRVETSTPSVTAVPTRPPDMNGWYNHSVGVAFQGSAFSGIASCTPAITYSGPDMPGATASGSCTDNAGKTASASFALNYDATPPAISGAIPARPPDYGGWYNHPVSFAFTATDATSGIEGCTTVTYSGPDSEDAKVIGSCRDRAGNVATLAVPIRYQATPPTLTVTGTAGEGMVLLRWQASAMAEIARSPGLHGAASSVLDNGQSGSFTDSNVTDGVHYKYTLTARDQAGNATVRTIVLTPGPRLLAPTANARLTTAPLLRWTPVRGASYYNVQLYRGARKVLSLWPARASLRLKRSWRFAGRLRRMTPGRYIWYVWPGYGARAASRYGRLIGTRTFVFTARPGAGQKLETRLIVPERLENRLIVPAF